MATLITLLVGALLLDLMAFKYLWNVYMVSMGLPPVSYAHVVGLIALYAVTFFDPRSAGETRDHERALSVSIAVTLLAVTAGWLGSFWI